MSAIKMTAKQKEQAGEPRKSLIEKVKSYWPDLAINDGNLQKPTQSFVYVFYSRFYSEYEKNLFAIKTNLLKQEPEQLLDCNIYTDDICLGIKLRKICKQLNETMTFYLNDIFEPQPRRTVLFFSVFMNLLIYMKSDTVYVDEIREVVQKAEHFQKFYDQKQELLEEIKNMNLLHFKLESNIVKLTENIQSISNEYKNMLSQKVEKEYDYQNDTKVRNKLKEHVVSCDEFLFRLREETSSLQEQLIEENEIEAMKNKISSLEKELLNIDVDRSTIVSSLEEQEEKTKHYNKCLELLQHQELNSDQLNNFKASIESIVDKVQEIKKCKEHINNKIHGVNESKSKQQLMEEKIEVSGKKLLDLNIEMDNNIKELRQTLSTLSEIIRNEKNECKNFENHIVEIQNKISGVNEKKSFLVEECIKEYDKLIEKQSKIYNCFNNAVINIDKYQNMNFDI